MLGGFQDDTQLQFAVPCPAACLALTHFYLPALVQVFDANSRSVLRQFKAHQRPTHVARFSPDKVHVLSGSDDVTIR